MSQTINIYRIEDRYGYGYKGKRSKDSSYYESLDSIVGMLHSQPNKYSTCFNKELRPLPWNDGIPKSLIRRDGFIFGFQSIELLQHWFSPHDLYYMSLVGGIVKEYNVSLKDVWLGNNQCVFYEPNSKLITAYCTSKYTSIDNLVGIDYIEYELLKAVLCPHYEDYYE